MPALVALCSKHTRALTPENFCQAMLSSLDPYTEFENVESAQEMREATLGNYAGVGLVVNRPRYSTTLTLFILTLLNYTDIVHTDFTQLH